MTTTTAPVPVVPVVHEVPQPPPLATLRVGDIMTTPVRTVPADMPVPEAYQLMAEKGIRRLPVVEHDRLVGIVTLGDLREARPSPATSLSIHELNYLLARLPVSGVMTRHPITVTPETPLRQAAGLLLSEKIGGLPVVDPDGAPVGIITESDLFRLIITRWHELPGAPAS